jgi:hypothetical protein
MKLFTTIYAECDGRVAEIGAPNASLAEYGQMLFVIEPSLKVAQHGKDGAGRLDLNRPRQLGGKDQ